MKKAAFCGAELPENTKKNVQEGEASSTLLLSEKIHSTKPFRQRLQMDAKQNWPLYLMALPVIVFFIIFSYIPMAGIVMAFQNVNISKGIFGGEWIGIKNFTDYFTNIYFSRTMVNTLIFSFLQIIFVFPSSIVLALMLNGVAHKIFKRTVQTIYYMPFFISTVVVCGLIKSFLDPTGFIGSAFANWGWIDADTSVLIYPKYFRAIIIITDIWQGIGFGSIIYVAALSSIDKTLYEAADIDGAGRWTKLWYITLPSILPMIMLMLILKIGSLLSVGIDKIVALYNAETRPVAETISSYVYNMSFGMNGSNANYGLSTAVGLFQSVASLILLGISNWLGKKFTGYGLV